MHERDNLQVYTSRRFKPILQGQQAMKSTALFLTAALLFTTQMNAALVTISSNAFDLTYDDETIGLFGTPQISGNTVFFTPHEFSTTSLDGNGTGFVNSTLHMTLQPKPSVTFTSFSYVERGDYILEGEGASVNVSGQIRVRSVNDVLSESSSFMTTDAPLDQQGLNNWEAEATIDGSTGDWKPDGSGVILTLENILTARTDCHSEIAFIEKKFIGFDIGTSATVVPLPSAFVFLMSSLFCGGFLLRKKK